jgi:hypothetical protein
MFVLGRRPYGMRWVSAPRPMELDLDGATIIMHRSIVPGQGGTARGGATEVGSTVTIPSHVDRGVAEHPYEYVGEHRPSLVFMRARSGRRRSAEAGESVRQAERINAVELP